MRYRGRHFFPGWAGLGLLMAWIGSAGSQVEVKTIDGIQHVLNPAMPIKGLVKLELEKVREIDPYAISDLNLRFMYCARAGDGSIVLYDPNQGEAGRFSPEGKFLGRLFPKGQGPGEFSSNAIIYPRPGGFLATDLFGKIVKFDKDGKFVEEWKISNPAFFILDEDSFLEEIRKQDIRTIRLIHAPHDGRDSRPPVVLFEAKETWMHRASDGSSRAFGNIWVTPNILEEYDPETKRIYLALNKTMSIRVLDSGGKILFVIDKPHTPIKLGRKEKETLVGWKDAADNWKINVCPDHLVALRDLAAMPGGRLGAFRFVSRDKVEIDVFDAEGRFSHTMILPDEVSLREISFFASGIAGVEYRDETNAYVEYRIKNLPEIFR
jgi:hypothetical protein